MELLWAVIGQNRSRGAVCTVLDLIISDDAHGLHGHPIHKLVLGNNWLVSVVRGKYHINLLPLAQCLKEVADLVWTSNVSFPWSRVVKYIDYMLEDIPVHRNTECLQLNH